MSYLPLIGFCLPNCQRQNLNFTLSRSSCHHPKAIIHSMVRSFHPDIDGLPMAPSSRFDFLPVDLLSQGRSALIGGAPGNGFSLRQLVVYLFVPPPTRSLREVLIRMGRYGPVSNHS
jgi:hypothetical protein